MATSITTTTTQPMNDHHRHRHWHNTNASLYLLALPLVKWLRGAWATNSASAVGIVFIPVLLVAASLFPWESLWLYTGAPCYWLFVDCMILCFLAAALLPLFDICADFYHYSVPLPGDRIPVLAHCRRSYAAVPVTLASVIAAALIRIIGSCFALLVLLTGTSMSLLNHMPYPPANQTQASMFRVLIPPGCQSLSSSTYNFHLFFGFAVIAFVFIALRLAFVRNSVVRDVDDDSVVTSVVVPDAARNNTSVVSPSSPVVIPGPGVAPAAVVLAEEKAKARARRRDDPSQSESHAEDRRRRGRKDDEELESYDDQSSTNGSEEDTSAQ